MTARALNVLVTTLVVAQGFVSMLLVAHFGPDAQPWILAAALVSMFAVLLLDGVPVKGDDS